MVEEGALLLLPSPRRLRWRHSGGEFGPKRSGICWGDLRPWREEFVVEPSPVHFSAEGVLGCSFRALPPRTRAATPGPALPWSEVRDATRQGRDVVVNSRPFVSCSTAQSAARLAKLIAELAAAAHDARQQLLSREVRREFDIERTAADLSCFRELSKRLRIGSATTLALWPPALLTSGWVGMALAWPWLLGLGLASNLLLITLFLTAHRRLYPDLADERWGAAVVAAVFPPAAWRLFQKLGRGVVSNCHPATAALALEDRETSLTLTRGYLCDLLHPVLDGSFPDDRVPEIERTSRESYLAEMKHTLARLGISPDRLLADAPPVSETAKSACPRCGAEFRVPSGECTTCSGVALRRH